MTRRAALSIHASNCVLDLNAYLAVSIEVDR
jgi:hypothetical protein